MFIKDKNFIKDEKLAYHGNARRSYYILRGMKISEEQAFDIIANESRRLDFYDNYNKDAIEKIESVKCGEGEYDLAHTYIDLLKKPSFNWIETFIDPMGNVGTNSITYQWPDEYDFLTEHVQYANRYPYLSYVVIYTDFDEVDYECSIDIIKAFNVIKLERIKEMFNYAIYVHDCGAEVIDKEEAFKIYDKYMKDYSCDEIFCRDDYNEYVKTYADEEYIDRLCNKWKVTNELRTEIKSYNNTNIIENISRFYRICEDNIKMMEGEDDLILEQRKAIEMMKRVENAVKNGDYSLESVYTNSKY